MLLRLFLCLIAIDCCLCDHASTICACQNCDCACGPNKVWTEHVVPCPPQTCAAKGTHFYCPYINPEKEPPGCICKKGYMTNEDGVCIPSDDCPPNGCNGDPNAHPGCGLNCGRTCADYKDPPCDCDERIGCIEHGCDCNDGYVKDPNVGKCVKPDDCTPQCGANETYSLHPIICPPDTCDAIGEAFSCPSHLTSDTPACVCKDGYYRDKEKHCVLKDDCDSCASDPNAQPGCGDRCGRTCADRDKDELCDCPTPTKCPGYCDCKEGYWYNTENKTCVLPCDCPPKGCGGDPNAHPGCGLNCGRTCADYKDPPCDCDERIGCIEHGCDCNDGYVKDPNVGKCVKPDDCTPTCKEYEVYNSCGTACQPYCDNLSPTCTKQCVPGCFCEFGYTRKYKDGPCIKLEDCESCNGDPNARPGCGNPCGHTCADVGQPPSGCSTACRSDGCDCIKGYVLDTNIHKCVKPCDCS